MISFLRRRAVQLGFLGDSKVWFRIGVVLWSIHFLRRLVGGGPRTVFEAELEPGETLVISDLSPIEAKGPGKSVRLDA